MLHFWQHFAGPLLRSNFLIALLGLGAYWVYLKQKKDHKRDAANVILLEIESAEQQLTKINRDSPFDNVNEEHVFLMKEGSWNKYRYLFVKDFDRNEWDKISEFYNQCQAYDDAVRYYNSLFDKNAQEVRQNLQRVLARYAEEHASNTFGRSATDKQTLDEAYIKKRQQFVDIYMNTLPTHMYVYLPEKPSKDAIRAAKTIADLSITSVGIKLKRLSTKNTVSGWFRCLFTGSSSQL